MGERRLRVVGNISMFWKPDFFLGFPRVDLAGDWSRLCKKYNIKQNYRAGRIVTHHVEVGALHATHGGGQDDEVDCLQVTILQAESPHLPGVQDGEEDSPLLLVRHD